MANRQGQLPPSPIPDPTFRCIFCGNIFPLKEKTDDHIPSRSLFPRGKTIENPIIIAACDDCNKSYSLDEEFFRIFLVNQTVESSLAASELFYNQIARSIKRRPQLGHKIMQNMKLVDLYTDAGLYLGKKTAIHIPKADWVRYFHVLDKYIKGIYFHERGERIEDKGFAIQHKHIPRLDKLDPKLFGTLKPYLDNKTVFASGTSFIPSTGQGIVIMTFFESVNFMSFVASEENFKKFEEKAKNNSPITITNVPLQALETESVDLKIV